MTMVKGFLPASGFDEKRPLFSQKLYHFSSVFLGSYVFSISALIFIPLTLDFMVDFSKRKAVYQQLRKKEFQPLDITYFFCYKIMAVKTLSILG